ncbi:hypothetical protein EVAR_75456_1 [Eumeta japonica]|uniref:Uncharacterized protein n=1 Tax=Eumeta variegata TaxID=151549 RepID=A0A4C1TLA2_EUMVA|nr:hypothetical protein EVAR_75456_1 [Eumeta japonica]
MYTESEINPIYLLSYACVVYKHTVKLCERVGGRVRKEIKIGHNESRRDASPPRALRDRDSRFDRVHFLVQVTTELVGFSLRKKKNTMYPLSYFVSLL